MRKTGGVEQSYKKKKYGQRWKKKGKSKESARQTEQKEVKEKENRKGKRGKGGRVEIRVTVEEGRSKTGERRREEGRTERV